MKDHGGTRVAAVAILLLTRNPIVSAAAPADLARTYAAQARPTGPQAGQFSAARGKAFFESTHGGEWSCSSCHTDNPLDPGRHARTGKMIAPLAPAAHPDRFSNLAKAEKWFRRNCNDVLRRECTAQEKGDVLAYLMQLAPPGLR